MNVTDRRRSAILYLGARGVLITGRQTPRTKEQGPDNRVQFACGCRIVDPEVRWKGRCRVSQPCAAHAAALGGIER